MTPLGEYILLGGGVNDFVEDALKDNFDMGGAWNVRLGVGSRYFVGAEVAYVGSLRSATSSDNDLTTHGLEGVLRLQYPYVIGSLAVRAVRLRRDRLDPPLDRQRSRPASRTRTTSASSPSARA